MTFQGRASGKIDASSFESRLSASFADRLFQFPNSLFKFCRLDDFGERLHHLQA